METPYPPAAALRIANPLTPSNRKRSQTKYFDVCRRALTTSNSNRNLIQPCPHGPCTCGHAPLKQKPARSTRARVNSISSIVATPVAPKCTFPDACHAIIPKAACPHHERHRGRTASSADGHEPRGRCSGPSRHLCEGGRLRMRSSGHVTPPSVSRCPAQTVI